MGGQQGSPVVEPWIVNLDKFGAFVARTPGLQQMALAPPSEVVASSHAGDLGELGGFLVRTSILLKLE